jgi:WD40 repeat protein
MAESPFVRIESNLAIPVRGSSLCLSCDEVLSFLGSREGILLRVHNPSKTIDKRIETRLGSIWSLVASSSSLLAAGASAQITEFDFELNEIRSFVGHMDEINGLVLSPCFGNLFSCGDDKTVMKWELRSTNTAGQVLYSADNTVYAIDASKNGEMVASGDADRCVVVFSLKKQRIVARFCDAKDRVWCVRFGKNDATVIYGDEAGEVGIIGASSGLVERRFKAHDARVRHLNLSSDGAVIVTASLDLSIKVWGGRGKEIAVLKGHSDWVKVAIMTKNKEKVYSTGDDGKIIVWDVGRLEGMEEEVEEKSYGLVVAGAVLALGIVGFLIAKKR